MIIIPLENFEQDILMNLLEELTSRDGTDYGAVELSQAQKIAQAMQHLQMKRAYIGFDPLSETTSLVSADEARQMGLL